MRHVHETRDPGERRTVRRFQPGDLVIITPGKSNESRLRGMPFMGLVMVTDRPRGEERVWFMSDDGSVSDPHFNDMPTEQSYLCVWAIECRLLVHTQANDGMQGH